VKLELGVCPPDADPYEVFISTLRTAGASENTVRLYSTAVREFLKFAKKNPREITTADINAWLTHIAGKRTTTIRYYMIAVNRFLRWLQVDVRPPMPRPRPRKVRALERDEVERLFSVARGKELLILSLLLDTGLRAKELLSLKREDVDLESRSIRVKDTKNGEERVVFFTNRTSQMMKEYLKSCPDKLFDISYQGLYKMLKGLGRRAGVQLRPHVLRHTFATNAARRAMPLPALQAIMGHKDIKTTQIYMHLVSRDLQEAYTRTFMES
jgi:integrase/recombinase XerD